MLDQSLPLSAPSLAHAKVCSPPKVYLGVLILLQGESQLEYSLLSPVSFSFNFCCDYKARKTLLKLNTRQRSDWKVAGADKMIQAT